MKYFIKATVVLCVLCLSFNLFAKNKSEIRSMLDKEFAKAIPTRGLDTAAVDLNLSTIRSYVVLMKAGIPAQRAEFYISWGKYDYRGVSVENGKIKTRKGKVYAFLKPGDIMAVADVEKIGKSVYIRLISPEIYKPDNRSSDKRFSRVTLSLKLKIPKNIYKTDDANKTLDFIQAWLMPFNNYNDAKEFSSRLKIK